MIYGMYLSAKGILASSYRQDVISNNLANAETVGFKKDLALFEEQHTQARLRGLNPSRYSNPTLEQLGGGLRIAPTALDRSQGELEHTGSALDVAIQGDGFFAVRDRGRMMLTRDGRFSINPEGYLAMMTTGAEVLDTKGLPIAVRRDAPLTIGDDGAITQGRQVVGQIGRFDVPQPHRLQKHGASLLAYPDLARNLRPADAAVRSTFLERANVEPVEELAKMMQVQRQLDANAAMIRYQDQTLGRLVNDVGRIG